MVIVTLVGVALAATAAFAAWTATGSGSGYAKATTAIALITVDVSASTTAQLYPGANGDLKIEFDNPNPYPVKIGSVSQVSDATHYVVGSGGLGSCTDDPATSGLHPTGVSLTTYTATSGDIINGGSTGVSHPYLDVPAKVGVTDGTATFTITGLVGMSNSSDNNCQGATFAIPVTFTGLSNA